MRKILFLFIFLPSLAHGQQVKLGTVFTIEFSDPGKSMDFSIVDEMHYDGLIDPSKIDSTIIKSKPAKNQIIGVFAKGKFGNSVSTMLVLISGLDDILGYDLQIKIPGNERFEHTSTSMLLKWVKSIEYWPYNIEKINFNGFKIMSKESFATAQVLEKIDSTCIKHADQNIEQGEKEFESHLRSIVLDFKDKIDSKLAKQLAYEKSLNSTDVSLGWFWSLGKDIYPNKKRFKLGNPLSFRRVECPYFEGRVHYFYTKKKRVLRVVEFDWTSFKGPVSESAPGIKNFNLKFIEKYDDVVKTVSDFLGKSLAIPQEKDSGRVDTKWLSANGINAYLFRFIDYNEIRLFIYKE